MGRENLLYRPGRASGEKIVETPDAQLLGNLEFDFALYIYNDKFDNSNIANIAKRFLSPIQVYEYADFLNGRLIFAFRDEEKIYENEYSLINIYDENFTISSIKKEEKGNGIIIRLFNSMKKDETRGYIEFNSNISKCYETMLDESYNLDNIVELKGNKVVPNSLSHCKVQTILIK